jgi:serine/threonine protein kinase/tetratricopeptide (TPR) repeat protein
MSGEPADKRGQSETEGTAPSGTVDHHPPDDSTSALPSEDDGSTKRDQTPRLAPGQTLLGRFTVIRFIASGGMGSVYEASDLTLRTRVALKVLRPQLVEEVGGVERFHREVLLARRVSHPNVCRVYELFDAEADGAPLQFLTMELLEGETLARRLLRDRSLTTSEALSLVTQMCDGLAAAHAEGVIHRDFKASNVVLVPRPGGPERVVITDFGVARAVAPAEEDSGALTGGAALVGTPEYMAPEQVTGGPVSPATDVYALGVVMYEMVTGSRPFSASTPLEAAVRRIHEPAPRPERALPSLDPRWSRTIHRCLEVEPSKRFERVQDVCASLSGRRSPVPGRWTLALLAVLLIVLGVSGVAARRWMLGAPSPPTSASEEPRSIAVLAFSDMSPDHDQEYFSDGVAQEIISALTEVRGLRVVARSSSFSFKGKNEDLRAVGNKLNVAHVLEGSVRKAGRQVRVTVQLVNAADGYQVWSRTFDRELGDIFSLQAEIARSVASALEVKALPGVEARSGAARPIVPEAYAAYLRGQQLTFSGSATDFLKAREQFKKAINLDPGYAQAYAALAHATVWYESMATGSSERVNSDWRQHALETAERAVTLAPALAEAYVSRAEVRSLAFAEWEAAANDYQKALALAPGNASALAGYAGILATLGRTTEGVRQARLAAELDPLSAEAHYFLGSLYAQTGQYALAKEALGKAEALAPNHLGANFLGWNELLNGNPAEALAIFQAAPQAWARDWGTALVEHTLGNDEASRQALRRLIASASQTAAYQIAQVYAWRGERDLAFEWLGRALASHDGGLAALKSDPMLRGLRGDRRYQALLVQLRLPSD